MTNLSENIAILVSDVLVSILFGGAMYFMLSAIPFIASFSNVAYYSVGTALLMLGYIEYNRKWTHMRG